MDGLRSVFNEGPRYFRRRYISLLRFLENDKLTRAGIFQNDHTLNKTLQNLLEFIFVNDDFMDLLRDKVEFHIEAERALSANEICYWRSGLFTWNWGTSVSNDARSTHVDRRLGELNHLFAAIKLIRLIGTMHSTHGIDVEDIWNAQFVAGSRLLQCLETALSNSSLSDFDANALRALVKILSYIILAVMESGPRVQSLPVSLLCIRVPRQLMRAEVP